MCNIYIFVRSTNGMRTGRGHVEQFYKLLPDAKQHRLLIGSILERKCMCDINHVYHLRIRSILERQCVRLKHNHDKHYLPV